MINMQSDLAIWIERVNITGACATKLTSESVTFKDFVAQLGAYCPGNNRSLLKSFQYVLARLQVCPVNVRLDLKTFLVAQFAYAARIFTDASNFTNFLRCQNLADIGNEVLSYLVSCAHDYYSTNRESLFSNLFSSFIWHCQITRTFHPSFFKSRKFRRSLAILPSIFLSQKGLLVSGRADLRHPL
jgi:hypothetical protein